jgi:hypothetical protein
MQFLKSLIQYPTVESVTQGATSGATAGVISGASGSVLRALEKLMPPMKSGVNCDIASSRVARAFLITALVTMALSLGSWGTFLSTLVAEVVFGILIIWAVHGCHVKRSVMFYAISLVVPVFAAVMLGMKVYGMVKKGGPAPTA